MTCPDRTEGAVTTEVEMVVRSLENKAASRHWKLQMSLGNLSWSLQGPSTSDHSWCVCVCARVCVCTCVCSVISNSLQPYGLQPTMLLCPWDSPGKNTGVDSHYLLQQTFLTYGSNPCLLHWQTNSLPSEPPWKPTDSLTIATQTPLEILASWFVTEPIFLWFGATKLVVLSDRLPKQ